MDREALTGVSAGITALLDNIRSVISIDRLKLEHLVAAHIAGGHILLADNHGVGKTSLARALAGSIRWPERDDLLAGRNGVGSSSPPAGGNNPADTPVMDDFSRVQCTVDLLPQDILGYNRMSGVGGELVFNKGPIFSHFVLCDEINLLTPKTQGSFFQAMEEQAVTVEGRTYSLFDPFFIIATMNLKGAHLFPLPAPQLDRFMIQLSMGYPPIESEIGIVRQHGQSDSWKDFGQVVRSDDLLKWKAMVDYVYINEEVVSYIVSCVRRTREHSDVLVGASPRTGVKVSRLARALSLIRGFDYTTIDTVKEIFPAAVTHRIVMKNSAQDALEVIEEVMDSTPVEAGRG